METPGVLDAVADERFDQDRRWGEQNHADPLWAAILGKEFGEVCREIADPHKSYMGPNDNYADLRKELVRVAAVAVAWIECIDRRKI